MALAVHRYKSRQKAMHDKENDIQDGSEPEGDDESDNTEAAEAKGTLASSAFVSLTDAVTDNQAKKKAKTATTGSSSSSKTNSSSTGNKKAQKRVVPPKSSSSTSPTASAVDVESLSPSSAPSVAAAAVLAAAASGRGGGRPGRAPKTGGKK